MKSSKWIIIFGLMLLAVNIGQLARILEIDRNLHEQVKGVQAKLALLDESVNLCSGETAGQIGR